MPLIVDASIWIDHLHQPDPFLAAAMRRDQALLHPFTLGEIAMGSLRDREAVLADLARRLPPTVASDVEVLAMVEQHGLWAKGIGWVDAHLLAATLMTPEASLWTRDKRLNDAARSLGLAAQLAN